MLEARNLTVGHGRRAVLSGLNLAMRPGEVLCLLGPNGGGKTTLLRTLLGLIPPLGGEVRLEGQPITRLSRRDVARRLAYVPQAGQGGFAYPARAVVAMGRAAQLGLFAAPGAADHAAAEAALARLSISHLADRPVTELSGGERQLVLIARALAQGGSAIILDEPTASLDFGNQALVLREVRALAKRDGLAVLMTTHQPDHALLLADAVMLVAGGGAQGPALPEALITPGTLRAAYGVEAVIGALGGRRVVAPLI
jgi:iron complex transport system ATP-binding protein